MNQVAREIVLYAFAMAIAFAVDIACLAFLVEVASVGYLSAAFVAFIAGGLVAYILSIRFIFSHRRVTDQRVEVLTFVSLGVVGLAVNMATIAAAVELAAIHYLVAKVLAAGLSFFVNYGLRRLLLFTPRAHGRSNAI